MNVVCPLAVAEGDELGLVYRGLAGVQQAVVDGRIQVAERTLDVASGRGNVGRRLAAFRQSGDELLHDILDLVGQRSVGVGVDDGLQARPRLHC